MYISTNTVVQKMQKQLQLLQVEQNTATMKDYMVNIKLLSELWLDEYEQKEEAPKEKKIDENKDATKSKQLVPSAPINMEDDGTSIFDF